MYGGRRGGRRRRRGRPLWQAGPVTDAGPEESTVSTVALDYGQFYLVGAPPPADLARDIDLVDLIGQANDGDRIAQSGNLLIVLSPHQNNFEMSLTVQRWAAEPPPDLPAWQEVFEATLEVGAAGLRYESPTLPEHNLPVPAGRYAVRIAGRGFLNHGWPGSTTPGDEWRIQLWPSTARRPATRVARWAGPPES
jgi:hypothetical protein